MLSRLRAHPSGLHLGLMLALTFSTGVVDAVGYLGLDRVFTGNMTGNVVILAMALADPSSRLPVIGPIVALACFLVGAAIAGRVFRGMKAGWYPRTTVLPDLRRRPARHGRDPRVRRRRASGAARLRHHRCDGSRHGHAGRVRPPYRGRRRHDRVVTSTLVGHRLRLEIAGGKDKHPWPRRAGAILLIGAGAAAGALLLHMGSIGYGLLLAALITAVVVVLGTFGRPHPVDGDPAN